MRKKKKMKRKTKRTETVRVKCDADDGCGNLFNVRSQKVIEFPFGIVARYIQCPKCGKKYLTTIYTLGMFGMGHLLCDDKFKKKVLLEQKQLILKAERLLQQYNIQYYHILADIDNQLDEITESEESVNGNEKE